MSNISTNNTLSSSQVNNTSCLGSHDSVSEAVSFITTKHKKPKRNRSAFILFSNDARSKSHLGQNISELNPNDRFVKIAQLWKESSQEERHFYKERANHEKLQYHSKLNNFCQLFPATIINKPRNRTKRPCNPYGYFLKDNKDAIRSQYPSLRMCEVIKIIAEKWRALDPSKKAIYEARAKENQKIYNSETKKDVSTIRAKKIKLNSGLEVTKDQENEQEDLLSDETEDLAQENISSEEVSVKDEEDIPNNRMPTKTEDLYQTCLSMIGFQQYQNHDPEAGKSALLDLYEKVESLRKRIITQIDRITASKSANLTDCGSTASVDLEDLKTEK